MATLDQLRRPKSLKRGKQRVGRGQSSGRGKQSGRGGKGQTARAGAKIRPAWRDIVKKLPKRRGFGKNRGRTVVGVRPSAFVVSIATLEKHFDAGATVSLATLVERGVLSSKGTPVKIVGNGELRKALSIEKVPISASARAAVEKAGGTIQ